MKTFLSILLLTLSFLCQPFPSSGQEKDSVETSSFRRIRNNIFEFARNAVTKSKGDTNRNPAILNQKSESPFLPYEGRIIRRIEIEKFGFEKKFTDTSKQYYSFGTRLLNNLHRDTRPWVIRHNLFISENTALDPYRVADNERWIRSLEFIQDARIVVKPVSGSEDSVDLIVITKDVFSLSGEVNDFSLEKFKATVSDANLLGLGQRVEVQLLYQNNRDPAFGYSLLYRKNNIQHTFINAVIQYSNIYPDLTSGERNEQLFRIGFERPLISPYSHFAGGVYLGTHRTINRYSQPDSLYFPYRYKEFDIWMGYNLGVQKILKMKGARGRTFVSMRYLNNDFSLTPPQINKYYNFRYNSRQAVLAQLTLFRQEYKQTNYLFGFGITEDIPYGYNISVTGGWYKQMDMKRPYLGLDANRYIVNQKGDIIQYYARAGSFFNNKEWQDAGLLVGANVYSRLITRSRVAIRQYIGINYARQFNRVGLDPLSINNLFGLRYYSSDSVRGKERIALHTETSVFIKYKLLGFRFAPFAFADLSVMAPERGAFGRSSFYYGVGGGVRARNENLIFGTIELRGIYFPRKGELGTPFKILLSTNLRFRYNSSFIKPPDIIQLNQF